MSRKTILTFIGQSCTDQAIDIAMEIAKKDNLHLSIILTAIAPQVHVYGHGMPYASYTNVDSWHQEIKSLDEALNAKSDELKSRFNQEDISADIITEFNEITNMRSVLLKHTNVADDVILIDGNGLAGDILDIVTSAILFDTHHSLLKNIKNDKQVTQAANIFIAWDSSQHVAKAIHAAMPYLESSSNVTIGIFDPVTHESTDGEEPGAELASWLSRHGCRVTIEQYPSGGEEIAKCITKRATEKSADLIIMGAYGHMKLKQQIFGGTTQTMLTQNKIPLLMAHN